MEKTSENKQMCFWLIILYFWVAGKRKQQAYPLAKPAPINPDPKYLSTLISQMETIHQMIIIGAGISGIGASRTLSNQNVPHLILQSRDRFGGRIYSNHFAGCNVQMGATFVHCPTQHNNLIYKYLTQEQIETIPALDDSEHYYYEDQGPLKQNFINQANEVYEDALELVEKKAEHMAQDLSIAETLKEFMNYELPKENKHVQDTVFWKLNLEANIEGVDLTDLSAKAQRQEQDMKEDDLIPLEGGFSGMFQKLFQSCKATFVYNTRVVAVDMTGNLIVLRTADNKTFKAKRVISSLPLGILQRNLVQFSPPLPEPYQKAINSIGNGSANKLFCSFKKPFWGNSKGWINFVLKGQKYNRFPHAFIYPEPKNHILMVYIGGKGSHEIAQLTDQQIFHDIDEFLGLFLDEEQYELQQVKLTRWHLDDHSFGSYCYTKVGTTKAHFQQLRQPIQNRFWFIGEHTHPEYYAYTHGAYQTGVWAAQEAMQH